MAVLLDEDRVMLCKVVCREGKRFEEVVEEILIRSSDCSTASHALPRKSHIPSGSFLVETTMSRKDWEQMWLIKQKPDQMRGQKG